MDSVAYIRRLFGDARKELEAAMTGVTLEQAHWLSPGRALPLARAVREGRQGEDRMLRDADGGEISRLKGLQGARGYPD